FDSIGSSAKRNTTSKFLAIRGFEFTKSFGHINVFNTEWFAQNGSLTDLYDSLSKDTNSIAQWNHPGEFYGEFESYGHYSAELDRAINLMEIMNFRRNTKYEEYYVRALEKGWHISPSANSDMHETDWITGYNWRTAILADTLSQEGIFSAIRKHRTYATEDRNIRLYYTINDSLMGSIIKNPAKINLKVDISDPDKNDPMDKIALVEIIGRNGICVKSKAFDKHNVNWEIELNLNNESDTYFYVRVTNAGSRIVVSAPIWIDFGKGLKEPYFPPEEIPAFTKPETYKIFDISGRAVGYSALQKRILFSRLHSGVFVNSSGSLINHVR
ncbi:MAG: CehA/McbA family metallohydrolase, partial [Fibrobacter sp.]|nr:CehA/McbA family metallohydrolase [Fibrobacter sp.]